LRKLSSVSGKKNLLNAYVVEISSEKIGYTVYLVMWKSKEISPDCTSRGIAHLIYPQFSFSLNIALNLLTGKKS
jgi:hypothetical protein